MHIFSSMIIVLGQLLMSFVYAKLAEFLVAQTNPKTIRAYEEAYIPQYLSLQVINDFLPFFLLAFVIPSLVKNKMTNQTHTLKSLFFYFRNVIVMRILITNSTLFLYWIFEKILKCFRQISTSHKLSVSKKHATNYLKCLPVIDSAYSRINQFISMQYGRRDFAISPDIDGILRCYMTYVQNFSMIVFWTTSAPFAPVLIFIF